MRGLPAAPFYSPGAPHANPDHPARQQPEARRRRHVRQRPQGPLATLDAGRRTQPHRPRLPRPAGARARPQHPHRDRYRRLLQPRTESPLRRPGVAPCAARKPGGRRPERCRHRPGDSHPPAFRPCRRPARRLAGGPAAAPAVPQCTLPGRAPPVAARAQSASARPGLVHPGTARSAGGQRPPGTARPAGPVAAARRRLAAALERRPHPRAAAAGGRHAGRPGGVRRRPGARRTLGAPAADHGLRPLSRRPDRREGAPARQPAGTRRPPGVHPRPADRHGPGDARRRPALQPGRQLRRGPPAEPLRPPRRARARRAATNAPRGGRALSSDRADRPCPSARCSA